MKIDPLELSKQLIKCRSVTPHDDGVMAVLVNALAPLGFKCELVTFSEEGTEPVQNLYAKYTSLRGGEADVTTKNFCFAGHVDVVPAGDVKSWKNDPFAPEIRDGMLYGRGASDMKCAIACFIAACSSYIENAIEPSPPGRGQGEGSSAKSINPHPNPLPEGEGVSISLLITGDEEAISINGTKKMLGYLAKKGEKIDSCIVGEPTNPDKLGGMIKIGRRGSVTFKVTLWGKQGHVAYPHLADNPVKRLNTILHQLSTHELDSGNEFFQPSNLEIVSFDVNNPADNVIPEMATARFNIRFNNTHTAQTLISWVEGICESICEDPEAKYEIKTHVSGESFITKPGKLSDIVSSAIRKVTGNTPELSTTGGTSDARFIKDYCPVVEFGLCNKTAHKVDESASVDEIYKLAEIYEEILGKYFGE